MTDPQNFFSLSTSPLALGCWGFADPALWGETRESEAIAVIHAALDNGINLLDTAPGYGSGYSEELLGRALADRRDRALIATKVSAANFSASGVQQSLDASLQRLRTDHVDLLQIHWAGDEERFDEVVAAFEKAREAGKTRACGVCNFGPHHLSRLRAVGHGWVSNQLPYNLLWRAIEFEIVGPCIDDGLGIMTYSPLQQGLLAGKYATAEDVPEGRARTRHFRGTRELSRHGEAGHEEETFRAIGAIRDIAEAIGQPMAHVAIAWLRSRPGVRSIIVGATKPEQVADNATAARIDLAPDVIEQLTKATDPLKHALGPNPDMWASESRFR